MPRDTEHGNGGAVAPERGRAGARPRKPAAARGRRAPVVLALLVLGCTTRVAERAVCDSPRRTGTLSADVAESSGLAASRRYPGVFWTHNDSGGDAELFAIDSAGRVLGRVRVTGARNRDWEDLAIGPCGAGDCLYIADTGDNRADRGEVAIFRIPEPSPDDTASAPAERFPFRYPGANLDTEAIYVLSDGAVYLISKGRDEPVTVFRYPGPLRAGETVELRRVARLGAAPVGLPYQVTGAAAAPDGRWVAVRTYTAVQLYRVGWRGRLRPRLEGAGVDIDALAEPQGEAVAIAGDGSIVLTSEAGPGDVPGTISRIECRLD
ncbi:MAG TPA: hypothetical protein VF212_12235 [Longimicrobiales bacterium]